MGAREGATGVRLRWLPCRWMSAAAALFIFFFLNADPRERDRKFNLLAKVGLDSPRQVGNAGSCGPELDGPPEVRNIWA
jgi:hypothetical protein